MEDPRSAALLPLAKAICARGADLPWEPVPHLTRGFEISLDAIAVTLHANGWSDNQPFLAFQTLLDSRSRIYVGVQTCPEILDLWRAVSQRRYQPIDDRLVQRAMDTLEKIP